MYLGISGYNHESAAALINNDAKLIDYCREEALSRIKGDKSFPKRSIKKIIENNKLNIREIKAVVFYERPLSSFLHPIKTATLYFPKSAPLISHQLRNFKKSSIGCFLDLASIFPGLEKKLIYLDHHLSHTLNALPYSNNQTDICSVVVDGFGDRSTSSISQVNNPYDIREIWTCKYPVSLGLLYSAITDFLGFQVNEGEYKVMGLAAFGNKKSQLAKKVSGLLNFDIVTKRFEQNMSFFSYHISPTDSFSEKLITLLGKPRNPFESLSTENKDFQRYADIAAGAQSLVINNLRMLFEYAYSLTNTNTFLFSGGVAMNSASLDSIASLPFVEKLIVPPSPGDAGSAIGAAYYGFLKNSVKTVKSLPKPDLFPSQYNYKNQLKTAKKILDKDFKILTNNINDALKIAANLISKGEVIGTLIGNIEIGPRALGHRSLICDGKNAKAVNYLNSVIKNRSPFRPTAPCMNLEIAKKYYVLRGELMESYKSMGATCSCKVGSGSSNFPTSHIDGTARLQIIEDNSFLDKLFRELKQFDIEILANSSLNASGDPTCYDLIDVLMLSARHPLRYIITDFGLLESKFFGNI